MEGGGGGGRSGREEKFQPSAPDIGLAWILGLGRFKTVRATGRGGLGDIGRERETRGRSGPRTVSTTQGEISADRATTGEYWGGRGEGWTPEAHRLGAGECYSIYLSVCFICLSELSIYLLRQLSLSVFTWLTLNL